MKKKMKVHEIELDCWECLCGNKNPDGYGFLPCDETGRVIPLSVLQPGDDDWWVYYCLCVQCGYIIDRNSLEILGSRFDSELTPEERKAIYTRE